MDWSINCFAWPYYVNGATTYGQYHYDFSWLRAALAAAGVEDTLSVTEEMEDGLIWRLVFTEEQQAAFAYDGAEVPPALPLSRYACVLGSFSKSLSLAGERIVGMATIAKTDYYPMPEISPWISTIFVSEEFRGKRISEKLIDFINRYARGLGFVRTYIPSEHIGLYEKYGYRYLQEIKNYGNGIDRLYVKDIG